MSESAVNQSSIVEGLLRNTSIELGCNTTCVNECIAAQNATIPANSSSDSAALLFLRYDCMESCLCFEEPTEKLT